MVTTRRSTVEHTAVRLRAEASQRQRQRHERRTRDAAAAAAAASDMGVPSVYRDMLIEAGVPSPAARRGAAARSGDGTDVARGPPAKRIKRPGQKSDAPARSSRGPRAAAEPDVDEDDEDDMEFEDVVIPAPVLQTRDLDSEDEDAEQTDEADEGNDDEGLPFVLQDASGSPGTPSQPGTASPQEVSGPRTLELNLTAHESVLATLPSRRGKTARKKPLSRAEREHRLAVHKMHVLCLMAHAARRNRWCNAAPVQRALRPLLTDTILGYLNPGGHLTQFGQTESLKTGLQQAAAVFRARFRITERGMRRALWAESPDQLQEYALPSDVETVLDRDDFVAAARSLQGSRDVGAQLFCALLRAAGVETRLVCSLQPLSFLSSAPTMPRARARGRAAPSTPTPKRSHPIPAIYRSSPPPPPPETDSAPAQDGEALFRSPRRRLGHPDAAAYRIPSFAAAAAAASSSPRSAPPVTAHAVRGESAFPVYWVEVLDAAHQKWQPVDPLVTNSQWRPGRLEPPAADKANQLSYVIGYAAEGDAKDVTRRYAKAYNAKTKRTRVDGVAEPPLTMAAAAAAAATAGAAAGTTTPSSPATSLSGSRWLRRALRFYRASAPTDVDQIEDIELRAAEAREPMPRNVAEFQNHPVYALSRHLRRHEALVPAATAVGTVAAGAKAPLERIYRRRDVRVAYSADRWYRLGRVVRPNEIPAKWLPPPPASRRRERLDADDADDAAGADDEDDLFGDCHGHGDGHGHPSPLGVPLFLPEQTDAYRAPPVVGGRVPKNKFGNIDLYVPSMLPAGGAHVADDGAARAAFLLGVDYAPALAGFQFQGRKGTAVLRGAVVAEEHAEAVRAVLQGLRDVAVEAAAERRARAALRMWTVLLRGLRIRQRIRQAAEDRGENVDSDEEEEEEEEEEHAPVDDEPDEPDCEDAASDATEELDMVLDDSGGGGFVGGGGFLDDEDEDYGGGGFVPE